MDDTPSPRNFPDIPLSQRSHAREPSWISFREPELVSLPKDRKETKAGRVLNGITRVRSLPIQLY